PGFALTADNAAAIVELCRRLDGLPLALELAAARLSLLTPQALLTRMRQRLPMLTRGARDLPQRQQTLRNTLAWSYDLLDEREQRLFRRLAVFVGGFPLEAVASVWTDEESSPSSEEEEGEDDVVELVAQLLDKSLIQPTDTVDGEPRFRMLQTIREYALERLSASGEEQAVKRRHADFYLRLAETAEPHLLHPERDAWLSRLERAHDNLRAALAWSSSEHGAAQTGLRLAGALSWFWYQRGYLREGRTFLEALLARGEQADGSAARGKALSGASLLAWAQGDIEVAGEQAEESVALFRALGDPSWIAGALVILGSIQVSQGKLEAARASLEESKSLFQEQDLTSFGAFVVYHLGRAAFASHDMLEANTLYQQSLALFREVGDQLGEAMALTALGVVAAAQGDAVTAQSLLNQSLPLMRATGDRRDLTQSLLTAGTVRLEQGDLQQAHNLFTESLRLWDSIGGQENAAGIRHALTGLAEVAAAQGRAERAGRLLGAAKALSPLPANFFSEASSIDLDQDIAQARAHLDQAPFEAGWAAGQAMTQEQAISYALLDD
ncbi:MAG TPA: tetratricopeptide repeat protein, partial [Ktedonobacteraceae bacterium]|nr:tetratricopeptide repeat protein [Ktedonobacteraceae bacterium]